MPVPTVSSTGTGATVSVGAMKDTITIQTRPATNAYNKPGGPWTDLLVTVAKIEHLTGKEVARSTPAPGESSSILSHRVTIPFASGIEPRMRITFLDQWNSPPLLHRYRILACWNVNNMGQFTEMLCEEVFDNQ